MTSEPQGNSLSPAKGGYHGKRSVLHAHQTIQIDPTLGRRRSLVLVPVTGPNSDAKSPVH